MSQVQRARTADPLPRTVLAWQRTLLAIATNVVLLSLLLVRSGNGIWAVPVLVLAIVPVPAAVRRERSLLADRPPSVAHWKMQLVTAVVVLLAGAAAAVALTA